MPIKLEWQDYILAALIIAVLAVEFPIYNSLKQLPSPIYGGDIYYHFGVINHIYYGGSPFMSSQFLNEYAHYPWFFHWLVAVTANVTGIDLLRAAILSPLVITVLAGIIGYVIGKRIFDKNFALLASLLLMTLQIPNAVASNFAMMVSFPLFSYFLFFGRNFLQRLFAGIFYGLTGLGHVGVFIGSSIMLVLLFLGKIIIRHFSLKEGKLRITSLSELGKDTSSNIKWVLPILLIGGLIAMLFWFPPLFVYKGETPNRWGAYVAAGEDIGVIDLIKFFNLINTSRWEMFVITALMVIGIIFLLIKRITSYSLPLLIFISMFIGYAHPVITLPLLGISLGTYGFGYMGIVSTALFAVTAVFFLHKSAKKNLLKYAVFGAFAIVVISNASASIKAYNEDQWVKAGREFPPVTRAMFETADFIKTNTDVNDVFVLPHEETGFAVNSITGRKVLIARRTHASPFVDVNQRVADTSVILYGKNENKIKELIKKYNVKYLYEDFYSERAKLDCLNAWDLLDNPNYGENSYNCLRVAPEYEHILKENGLEYKKTTARLDVASPVAPRFELLAIKPGVYSDYILKNTKVLKEAKIQNQTVVRLLKI